MKNLNPNVSPIYLEAARSQLAQRYPMMLPSIREDLLKTGTFQELEAYTEIASTLAAVVASLDRSLSATLPKNMLDIVLHDRNSETTLSKTRNRAKLRNTDYGKIICIAAKAAHDHRVRIYAYPTASEKELLDFLPAELLGWDKFSENLIFVEPITKALGIEVKSEFIRNSYLRNSYRHMVEDYLSANEIMDESSLKHHLKTLKYSALPTPTLYVIRKSREALNRMVHTLINRPGSTLQRLNICAVAI